MDENPGAALPHGESVYRVLRRALVRQEIEPGSRLLEAELAERLKVSRTPVREALRRLESDGFVQRIGRGRLVATPAGPDDLGDIGLLRVEVDGLAARLACRRATARQWDELSRLVDRIAQAREPADVTTAHVELHRAIYAVGFGPRMSLFVDNHVLPYLDVAINPGAGETNAKLSARTHRRLVAALSSGDGERAVRAAREHAESGLKVARSRG